MKIILPEHIGEITLGQYQRYVDVILRKDLKEVDLNKRKIEIFANIPRRQVKNVRHKDYAEILEQIDIALNNTIKFTNTFEMAGVEYGFIPNFDKITTKEFVDLSDAGTEIKNLHKTMAILFRPITKKDGKGNYKIAKYRGTKDIELGFKEMPLHIVNGALDFFCNLAKELSSFTRRSIQRDLERYQKQGAILRSGVGTQLSKELPITNLGA